MMKQALVLMTLLIFSSFCYPKMYYISTPYGVMFIDIYSDYDLSSILYANNKLSFIRTVTLQLAVQDSTSDVNLALLLASFLSNYYQGRAHAASHGEGDPLEQQFLNHADDDNLEMITVKFERYDTIDTAQFSSSVMLEASRSMYPCMFNCGKTYSLPSGRYVHYKSGHNDEYHLIKKKYGEKRKCPYCDFIIINFTSLSKHINASHPEKSLSDF